MRKSEEMLFALLRASLHEKDTETSFFVDVTATDWKECYQLAKMQGVMALAWDGVLRLPIALHPDMEFKLQWGIKVEHVERRHQHYCKVASEITELYKQHDIATLHLKGVGLSTLYPVPSHREGGDIDIYTYAANKSISDHEANALADALIKQQGMDVDIETSPKHSFFYYKGIPVENHKTLLNVHTLRIAKQVEEILKEHMHPQSVSLGSGEILIPSAEFNALFVAFHAVQHFGSGLSIHHLCDLAVIMNRYGLHLPKEITDERLLRAIFALTTLCNRLLGTSIKVKEEKEFAEKILKEMLHPKYYKRPLPQSKMGGAIYKVKRFIYNQKLKKEIFDIPVWKNFCIAVLRKLWHPSKIFN